MLIMDYPIIQPYPYHNPYQHKTIDLAKEELKFIGEPIITDLLAQSPITQEQAETWVNAQIIDKSSLKPLQNQGYAKEDVRKDMVEFYRISGGNLRPSCSF